MPKAWPTRPGRRSWSRTPITPRARPTPNVAKLLGTVVRNPITAGQPLTQGALVGPNDRGFLAAALGPGMRAVTVPVSATTGVAGFVFPGDRVDMVLTQDVAGGGDGPPLKVSETIVRNLRVLATDQRIDSKDEEGKTVVKTFATVTLEATPRIAEKIAVAQSLGTLQPVAALDRRQYGRARARGRRRRGQGSGRHQPGRRAPDAAGGRQSPGGHQHDLHHRRRRVALPAPQRPGQGAVRSQRPATRRSSCANAARPPAGGRSRRRSSARSSASLAATMSPSFRWELVKMTSHHHPPPRSPGHCPRRAGPRPRHASPSPLPPLAAVRAAARPSETLNLSPGRPAAGSPVGADDRRVRRQRRDRRRPGALVDPALRVRQGPRRDHGLCHRRERPGRLCRQRPRRHQHRLGRRDAAAWRCRKRASRRRR